MTINIIIYSHGFGVMKDDRGLFTDVADMLPGFHHVMFDYNTFDETHNILTATPLDIQATILNEKTAKTRAQFPSSRISIIAHSQGCVVAAMAAPHDVDNTIFLAPPTQFLGIKRHKLAERPGTVIKPDGTIYYPRRDGSTTIIREDYWKSREGIDPISLYNALAKTTHLTIITATNDEVLSATDFSGLVDKIKIIELPADHDFTGGIRENLVNHIKDLLQ
jgi:hypothetical protein